MSEVIRVISLDRTPERFAQFVTQNEGVAVKRFPAVEGARLARSELVEAGLVTEENQYVPGALGLAMSHVTLWRQCAAAGGVFHVAEDDVVLRGDFWPASTALLAGAGDWDIVVWGHNLDWPVMVSASAGVSNAVIQYLADEGGKLDVAAFQAARGAAVLLRLASAAGTGCYSVSPAGAAKLLAACLPLGNAMARYVPTPGKGWNNTGIDVEMSRHYETMNAYVAMPPLALAPNLHATSTIRGHLAALEAHADVS